MISVLSLGLHKLRSNYSLKILQIVPTLPPKISGVGDYAYLLARQLRADHGINSRFLVCDPQWKGEWVLDGFEIHKLEARQRDDLVASLSMEGMPRMALLHYVGYGYEKRGCPFWLAQGLEAWKSRAANRRLVVMFHELYAFGPPWRSSFWASPSQRCIATHLANLADCCATNLRRYADWLGTKAGSHLNRVCTIPVFSTVGELAATRPLNSRAPNMILFGGAKWVKELLGKYRNETLSCCRALGIEQIVTVGSSAGTAPVGLPIPVTERGFMHADQVAEIIQSSRIGMMNYFSGYLAKSTVFAAYSALGALPILPRFNPSGRDGCTEGKTYLLSKEITAGVSNDTLQEVADDAWKWYQTHNLSRTARSYAELLMDCSTL